MLRLIAASLLILPPAFGQIALTTAQKTDGPSLKETLDWLKEKIPLAANHYVISFNESAKKDVAIRTLPTRLDSCTVSFDVVEIDKWNSDRFPKITTLHQTVPLGAVFWTKVISDSLPLPSYINGMVDEWTVILETTSKVILSETHEDLNNTTTSESQNFAALIFYEESIANRVAAAFKHAADLCRKKEPF